jgi:glutamate-ammonia-ligase adenylyltransferase
MTDAAFSLPHAWPAPADKEAAGRLAERFAALGAAEARLLHNPSAAAMLASIGGNSPYLSDLALREPARVRAFVRRGPAPLVSAALAALAQTDAARPRAEIAAALRAAKRDIALAVALADLGGIWHLEAVTAALSDLAERALALSVAHLLRAAHDRGELRLHDPADPAARSGFVVLGMGKLGARELNYSSDVDLVLLYDPEAGVYHDRDGGDAMGACFTRIARGLVALMEARDADGYVFRTDLRLRPDPAATPPAVALPAAIAYYESMGQNWERAAMIKARPVAGDIATGAAFLEAIRPFVWRRGLDFAAVADIHAMKRRIDAHKGGALAAEADPVARVAGHDVKLGEGGIREIEFLAQTLQLVWGGRDPKLRAPQTLVALRLLAAAGRLPRGAARELAADYRFLRAVEHRLQMVADRQTHALPQRADQLGAFAAFMGFDSAAAFAEVLLAHLGRVRRHYARVFEDVPDPPADAPEDLDFRGDEDVPPATGAALARLGFSGARAIVAAVRGWQAGRVRALRSHRARELIGRMLPAVLAALARQAQPDAAFARFDGFLAALPAGVQILSLFERNPALLDRVAAVLGAAPSLADHLSRYPSSIDGLITPDEGFSEPQRRLRARLADAALLEDAIGIVRASVREEDFAISVATMEGRLDADAAGERRSALAEAALAALLPRVAADFADRFGRVRGGGVVVVALGKAGGREMMAGSDLDLMLIYDHPEDMTESRGARALPASQYYIRLAQSFVAALTAPGADGPLYAVDMRLRPSGNKGPVAVSLAAFERYHDEAAWTWERMALTRARVVAGPAALAARVTEAIGAALRRAGEPARILADAAAMRARLARDRPAEGAWDVKHRAGGQMEVEFVAQALQLVHAGAPHPPLSPTTRVALARLRDAGALTEADAALLIGADRAWRTIDGMLRILVGRGPPAELPAAAAGALLAAARAAGVDAIDMPALRANLDALAHRVRAAFTRLVGEVGGGVQT